MRRTLAWLATSGLVAPLALSPAIASALTGDAPETGASGSARGATEWTPALQAWGSRREPAAAGAEAPVLAGSAALPAVGMSTTSAVADPPPRTREFPIDETRRWVPALAIQSGILGQGADGGVSSDSTITYNYILRQANGGPGAIFSPAQVRSVTRSFNESKTNVVWFSQASLLAPRIADFHPNTLSWVFQVPPPFPRNPRVDESAPTTLPAQGSELMLTPFVGSSFELMTPGLQDLIGRPRLFAHAGAAAAFSFRWDVAKEGVPGDVEYPRPAPVAFESEVQGVGSRTSSEVKPLVLSAGLGTAFTVDALDRRIRIKPSFEWMRQEIELSGQMIRVFRKDTGVGGGAVVPTSTFFLNPIEIETSDTKAFNGIGPGLEIEMDAARAGPIVLTLFVSGQAYRMLGNRDVELVGTAQASDPALTPTTQTVGAKFDFTLHRWAYQGGLGLRFRWIPED